MTLEKLSYSGSIISLIFSLLGHPPDHFPQSIPDIASNIMRPLQHRMGKRKRPLQGPKWEGELQNHLGLPLASFTINSWIILGKCWKHGQIKWHLPLVHSGRCPSTQDMATNFMASIPETMCATTGLKVPAPPLQAVTGICWLWNWPCFYSVWFKGKQIEWSKSQRNFWIW